MVTKLVLQEEVHINGPSIPPHMAPCSRNAPQSRMLCAQLHVYSSGPGDAPLARTWSSPGTGIGDHHQLGL